MIKQQINFKEKKLEATNEDKNYFATVPKDEGKENQIKLQLLDLLLSVLHL